MNKSSKRDLLIKTALELFNRRGFHAVGIDTILEESKISKKTLYKHFRSKNELILAVIRYYDETFRNFWIRELEKIGHTPREKILAIFDVAEIWFKQDSFHGCIAATAVDEFLDTDDAIHRSCHEFKRLIREYITKLAQEGELKEPCSLAEKVCLLLEGAIAVACINRDFVSARLGKDMVKKLIEDHQ